MGIFSFSGGSSDKISTLLDKIDEKYSLLEDRVDHNKQMYSEFNKRYNYALSKKDNLELFLQEELRTVEELLSKVKNAFENEERFNQQIKDFKEKDVLGKIQDDNMKKIESYHTKHYFDGMDYELAGLLGAFAEIYENIYPKLDKICKSKYNRKMNEDLMQVELSIYPFISTRGVGTYPDVLDKYVRAIKTRNAKAEEQEKTNILKQAIGVLSNFKKYIDSQIRENVTLSTNDILDLKKMDADLNTIISNFRLTSFILNK